MITIKELAEELGISKVSVKNHIDALGIRDELVKDGNRFLLSDAQADAVRASYQKRTATTASKPTQNHDELIIQALTAQLEVKDEQIAMLQAQVATLVDNLAEMNKSIQQGQYLLAEKTDTISHEVQAEVVNQETTYQDEKASFTDKIRFWNRRK